MRVQALQRSRKCSRVTPEQACSVPLWLGPQCQEPFLHNVDPASQIGLKLRPWNRKPVGTRYKLGKAVGMAHITQGCCLGLHLKGGDSRLAAARCGTLAEMDPGPCGHMHATLNVPPGPFQRERLALWHLAARRAPGAAVPQQPLTLRGLVITLTNPSGLHQESC